MSNRANPRKHGRHRAERLRPSSLPRIKAQKARGRIKQDERRDAIAEAKKAFAEKVAA